MQIAKQNNYAITICEAQINMVKVMYLMATCCSLTSPMENTSAPVGKKS